MSIFETHSFALIDIECVNKCIFRFRRSNGTLGTDTETTDANSVFFSNLYDLILFTLIYSCTYLKKVL